MVHVHDVLKFTSRLIQEWERGKSDGTLWVELLFDLANCLHESLALRLGHRAFWVVTRHRHLTKLSLETGANPQNNQPSSEKMQQLMHNSFPGKATYIVRRTLTVTNEASARTFLVQAYHIAIFRRTHVDAAGKNINTYFHLLCQKENTSMLS